MLPDLDHDRILATVPVNVSMPLRVLGCVFGLSTVHEPRALRGRTTRCLSALERKARAIGFMRLGFFS